MKRNIDPFLKRAANRGYLTVESNARGMGYIIDPDDNNHIMVLTDSGAIILNKTQAATLAEEAAEVLEVFTK